MWLRESTAGAVHELIACLHRLCLKPTDSLLASSWMQFFVGGNWKCVSLLARVSSSCLS